MKARIIIGAILILAFILRIYKITNVPPSLYWDEVAIGYNAWSILTTGKDEYGHTLPLLFESFQEYKLPGLIYTTVPFIKIFGLNEISIRLPSVIFGVLAVLFIYLLASELFSSEIGFLSALFLAVSPWHIQFSRAGFEANGGLTMIIIGVYCLVKGIRYSKWLYIGFFFSVLSVYFYYVLRLFVPLIILSYLYYYKAQKLHFKKLILPLVLGFIVFTPFLLKLFGPSSMARLSQVSIVNDESVLTQSIKNKSEDQYIWLGKIMHYRYTVIAQQLIRNYLLHYSPEFFLFGRDSNLRHQVPGTGLIYIWEFLLILVGLYILLRQKCNALKLVVPWLLLSPFAASFAEPSPHALRALVMVPILQILGSFGFISFLKSIGKTAQTILKCVLTVCMMVSVSYFLHQYIVHYPHVSSREWAYGYKEVVTYISQNKSRYHEIYLTGKYWRPYIFTLFYMQYPPELFQQNISHSKIGNIFFGHADYDSSDAYYDYGGNKDIKYIIRHEPKSLLILAPDEKTPDDTVVDTVRDLDGKPLFLFVET